MLTGYSPFLTFVSNTKQFDDRLDQYVSSNYVQQKYVGEDDIICVITNLCTRYQQLLGCDKVNLKNTSNLYARYTTSVICNSIVQNSVIPCKLSSDEARPLCAESCVSSSHVKRCSLTLVRPNKRPVRSRLPLIASFVASPVRITWTK